ncbi:phosphomevalonate kinase [Streptomyces sp. NPDC023327]|uniref:phosphomevalonate kinase n=1 Tax=Streptomyces sp. NPDC023327 TaxID=3157088 RepID=UPI0033CE120D
MPRTVTHTAPGKLFIAGEYAVLKPGQPAIVVAVDRFITVSASPPLDGEVELATDLLPREVRLLRGRTGLRPLDVADTPHLGGALSHLVSVVEVVDELRAQLALPPLPVRLTVRSDLHEQGVKIGLGSSGAVTVAAVTALTEFCSVPMSPELRFRVALLASIRRDAGPSGADLAASTWGGWIVYQAPDRARLLQSLRSSGPAQTAQARWPGFSVRSLPPPDALSLHTGWSGTPASTSARVSQLTPTAWWGSAAFHRFLARSESCVTTATHALDRGDPEALLTAIHDARHILAGLDQDTQLGIFTPQLTQLCTAAEAFGGAGKPSGAGGGDCGIALLPHTAPAHALRTRWAAAGITALPLHVTDPLNPAEGASRAAGADVTDSPISRPPLISDRGRSQ